ncbi:universal stress protein [Streptomyces sp. NPDC001380]|uniref:universal stress protein n=1 Tax=Streptomyces sp. NPDC001380 TaxID=3364566 RepID=UPI00367980E4
MADAAAALAAASRAPLLLIAVVPPGFRPCRPGPGPGTAHDALARVLARLGRAAEECVPVTVPLPSGGSRLAAASRVLEPAGRLGASVVVAHRTGPAGVDAPALVEAAALRGGPQVRTVVPPPWRPVLGAPGGGGTPGPVRRAGAPVRAPAPSAA